MIVSRNKAGSKAQVAALHWPGRLQWDPKEACFNPVCMGSWTGLRAIFSGAFTSFTASCHTPTPPFPLLFAHYAFAATIEDHTMGPVTAAAPWDLSLLLRLLVKSSPNAFYGRMDKATYTHGTSLVSEHRAC